MATQPTTEEVENMSIGDLLARNKNYAATTHPKTYSLLQMFKGSFSDGPKTLVIACLDSRSDPYKIFNLSPADAIVIRNPGGRVWSALSDIFILDSRFPLKQIIILQHSDCGTSHVTEELVDERLATGVKPHHPEAITMRNAVCEFKISRGEVGVRQDLELLRRQTYLREELVKKATGFWLDTFTGVVEVVEENGSIF